MRRTSPAAWRPDEAFELRVAESPRELERMLRAKTGLGASARMTAGSCWQWGDTTPGNPLVDDIVIGNRRGCP
jgi:hypothetical protein